MLQLRCHRPGLRQWMWRKSCLRLTFWKDTSCVHNATPDTAYITLLTMVRFPFPKQADRQNRWDLQSWTFREHQGVIHQCGTEKRERERERERQREKAREPQISPTFRLLLRLKSRHHECLRKRTVSWAATGIPIPR